jgi:hypothetical protein
VTMQGGLRTVIECLRTSGWNWHSGLDVVLPRGRSSDRTTSIERSRLVLPLSFTTSSHSSFASQVTEGARTLGLSLNVPISRLNSASAYGKKTRVRIRRGVIAAVGRTQGTDVEGCVGVARSGHDVRY